MTVLSNPVTNSTTNNIVKKPQNHVPILRIDAKRNPLMPDWAEMWQFREMLYFLVWRDIKVRYKQTILGGAWAIIQPFVTMVVFSIFFGGVLHVASNGVPYPIFSFTALVPWTFFSTALTLAANSLVDHAHIVRKVYFPLLFLPFARILAGLVDFALAFIVLIGMMIYYGLTPSLIRFIPTAAYLMPKLTLVSGVAPYLSAIIVIPLLTLLMVGMTLGTGLWLSAFYVRYRDIRHILPFLVQIWLFATPVIYPASELKSDLIRLIYSLNPMVSVIEGFRWVLLKTDPPSIPMLLASIVVMLIALVTGLLYFQRARGSFADVI